MKAINKDKHNIETHSTISFAEELCKDFSHETVLVKLYGEDRILFVKPKTDVCNK